VRSRSHSLAFEVSDIGGAYSEHTMRLRRDERGVTLIFLSLVLVGLLAIAGIVVDGGLAMADRRQAQNAADAAALAGTRALNEYRFNGGSKLGMLSAVQAKASEHNVDDELTCELIDVAQNTLGPCPDDATDPVPAAAFGVRAWLAHDSETSLMRVVGINSFTARGKAAATLQRALEGTAPFWMCATSTNLAGPPLLVADASLSPPWDINDAAIGGQYQMYGNDTRLTDCDNVSSSVRGLVDMSAGPYSLAGVWDGLPGNHTGPIVAGINGGSLCTSGAGAVDNGAPDPCILVIPLCTEAVGGGGANQQFLCQRLGTFRVQVAQNHEMEGIFLGAGTFVEGPGGGEPQAGEARTIKLVE
jgi:Tfp pilus assembly protein PilX